MTKGHWSAYVLFATSVALAIGVLMIEWLVRG